VENIPQTSLVLFGDAQLQHVVHLDTALPSSLRFIISKEQFYFVSQAGTKKQVKTLQQLFYRQP
jgi:hypothetical protein